MLQCISRLTIGFICILYDVPQRSIGGRFLWSIKRDELEGVGFGDFVGACCCYIGFPLFLIKPLYILINTEG